MDSAMSLYQLPDKPSDTIFQALILQAEALCSKEQRWISVLYYDSIFDSIICEYNK